MCTGCLSQFRAPLRPSASCRRTPTARQAPSARADTDKDAIVQGSAAAADFEGASGAVPRFTLLMRVQNFPESRSGEPVRKPCKKQNSTDGSILPSAEKPGNTRQNRAQQPAICGRRREQRDHRQRTRDFWTRTQRAIRMAISAARRRFVSLPKHARTIRHAFSSCSG